MSESLFLFLGISGKVVLLRSVRGKLMTHIKWGKFCELKYFYANIFPLEYCGLFQGSIRKEHVCFKYFVGKSAKKKKKEKRCSEESLWNI